MSSIFNFITSTANSAVNAVWSIPHLFASADQAIEKEVIIREMMPGGGYIVRLAGVSGALAVCLGAYGAHGLKDVDPERKYVFDTAYRMHLIHSATLIGVPLTRHPNLVGGLMCAGMAVFCGSCYLHAFTGEVKFKWITPIGGTAIIMAWLAMALP